MRSEAEVVGWAGEAITAVDEEVIAAEDGVVDAVGKAEGEGVRCLHIPDGYACFAVGRMISTSGRRDWRKGEYGQAKTSTYLLSSK